jgi:ABC-2 type transport system permease protein
VSFRRFAAVARKEFLHVLRDARSLALGLLIPAVLISLFGWALTLDVDEVPTVVFDSSETPQSRDFVSYFDGTPYFNIKKYVSSYRELECEIDHARALVAVVIPHDFASKIASGRNAEVQIIADGSDANTATIATGYANAVAAAYSQKIVSGYALRATGRTISAPLDFRPRAWYNPEMKSQNYIIPGLIAVIMMIIAAILTSLTVAREWERGTMEQLISTPVRGPELILGKLVPYFTIGMMNLVLAYLLGRYIFHVPMRGSVALLFALSAVFLAGALSMGMIISIVAKNQMLASQLAMITTFLPSYLLSGLMFSIFQMPAPLQYLSHIVPAMYYIRILRGIYLKGLGTEALLSEAALLAVFGAIVLFVANRKFRRKLD